MKPIHYVTEKVHLAMVLVIVLGAACLPANFVQGAGENDYKFSMKWSSSFTNLRSLAADNSGNVYVASAMNHNIQKFSSLGAPLTTFGLKGAENGQLNYPEGIAVDGFGNVYVCDQNNHRIQKFTSSGEYITKWGSKGSQDGQFNVARSITVDGSGNVYVADVLNNRIQKFTSSGEFITKWGSSGSENGQFNTSFFLAADSSGNIYATDTGNNRVQKFSSSGEFITKWGISGKEDGQFTYPQGVAVDGSGFVYIADSQNSRIQKFSPTGVFLAKWGSYGKVVNGQLDNPMGITVDGSGNVYVADTGNGRIQKFTPSVVTNLKIRVVNEDGTLVSGAAIASTTQPTDQLALGGTSSDKTPYTFNGLLPGRYAIQASKTGCKSATSSVDVTSGNTIELTLTLQVTPLTGDLKVAVKDKDGSPIAGASVSSTVQPSDQSVLNGVTGVDGTVTFSGVKPGSFTLKASKTGYLLSSSQGNAAAGSIGVISITLQVQPSASGGGVPGFPFESLLLGLIFTVLLLTRTRKLSPKTY